MPLKNHNLVGTLEIEESLDWNTCMQAVLTQKKIQAVCLHYNSVWYTIGQITMLGWEQLQKNKTLWYIYTMYSG